MGTNDAVAFSAMKAPALTVAIARDIATSVVPMGTFSDDDDDSLAASLAAPAASLAAFFAAPFVPLDALTDAFRRKQNVTPRW